MSLKPCGPGQYRNPKTNRCKQVEKTVSPRVRGEGLTTTIQEVTEAVELAGLKRHDKLNQEAKKRKELEECQIDLENCRNGPRESDEKIEEYVERISQLEEELKKSQGQERKLDAQIKDQIKDCEEKEKRLNAQIKDLKDNPSCTKFKSLITSLEKQLAEQRNLKFALEDELVNCNSEKKKLQGDLQKTQEALEEALIQSGDNTELLACKKRADDLNKKLNNCLFDEGQSRSKIEKLTSEIKQLKDDVDSKTQDLQKCQDKLEILENEISSLSVQIRRSAEELGLKDEELLSQKRELQEKIESLELTKRVDTEEINQLRSAIEKHNKELELNDEKSLSQKEIIRTLEFARRMSIIEKNEVEGNLSSLKREMATLTRKISECEGKEIELAAAKMVEKELRKEIVELKNNSNTNGEEVNRLVNQLSSKIISLKAIISETISEKDSKINSLKAIISETISEKDSITETLVQTKTELKELIISSDEKYNLKNGENERLVVRLKECEDRIRNSPSNNEMQSLRNELTKLQEEIHDKNEDIKRKTLRIEEIEKQLFDLGEDLEKANEAISGNEDLQDKLEELQGKFNDCTRRLGELQTERDEFKNKYNQSVSEKAILEAEISSLRNEMDELNTEIQERQNDSDENEDLRRTIQELEGNSSSLDSVFSKVMMEMIDFARGQRNKQQKLLITSLFKNLAKVRPEEIELIEEIFEMIRNDVTDTSSAKRVVKTMESSRYNFKVGRFTKWKL